MSGGSFDYVSGAELSVLIDKRHVLRDLRDALAMHPGSEHALAATNAFLLLVDTLEHERARLEAVWHAVEWTSSGDWGAEDVAEALAAHRTLPVAVEQERAQRVAFAAVERRPGGAASWPALVGLVAGAVLAAQRERDAATSSPET